MVESLANQMEQLKMREATKMSVTDDVLSFKRIIKSLKNQFIEGLIPESSKLEIRLAF